VSVVINLFAVRLIHIDKFRSNAQLAGLSLLFLIFASVVKSDHLSRWNLQFLINTSLQVLVQEGFKLFVLLVEKTSLFDQVLTVNKHLVVFQQRLV
jgi:hypothetical protein